MRVPNHIGIIPDGNRRWANNKGMEKQCGYNFGLNPGLMLFRLCRAAGINEITYYGFTTDNTKRPKVQRESFTKACVEAVEMLCNEDASLLVVGNTESPMFPKELLPYTKKRKVFEEGGIKVNFLVNYGWEWDLEDLENNNLSSRNKINKHIKSTDISRVDLIIRWGGRRRLSGFLPIQSVYSDFYIIEDYWPDFKPEHFYGALKWYDEQDITLGG
ncbi:di-trans,poly-cis-decaprenylcistransferase [Clostridium sporogenes]|uniref:polyprenyl diphosphate synthase n=1 Tax=Clostridium TaxID=1485 RepID=UPI00090A3197|nr:MULTISPECIES: polyprenyl diphosphate synthase [Clostridium]APF27777.1 di-trans,poly-cis-decaprenylcistransferase [Clostridium sporogenes]MDI6921556.1 polyprenyl diphosphate synthase [Clostridium botulinum]WMU99042.1 polyprenyl diphosphate synthase [Clostridium botulinum]